MLGDLHDVSDRNGRESIRTDKDTGGDGNRDGDGDGDGDRVGQSSVKEIRRSVRRGGVSRDRGTYKALIPILESVACATVCDSDSDSDSGSDSDSTVTATATLTSSLPLSSTTDVDTIGSAPSLVSPSSPVIIHSHSNNAHVKTDSDNRSINDSEKERKRAEIALETVRHTGRMEGLVFD